MRYQIKLRVCSYQMKLINNEEADVEIDLFFNDLIHQAVCLFYCAYSYVNAWTPHAFAYISPLFHQLSSLISIMNVVTYFTNAKQ